MYHSIVTTFSWYHYKFLFGDDWNVSIFNSSGMFFLNYSQINRNLIFSIKQSLSGIGIMQIIGGKKKLKQRKIFLSFVQEWLNQHTNRRTTVFFWTFLSLWFMCVWSISICLFPKSLTDELGHSLLTRRHIVT